MEKITVERNISLAKLDAMGVDAWPVWTKEVSKFDWKYEQTEVCYILEGEAIVTPEDGEPMTINEGDFVTFTAGLSCVWEVTVPIKKHYTFK
jgi:uncharacterized cupin superfamily protein